MPKVLTDHVVKTARPQKDQKGWREVTDGACRGLRLRIGPNGEKAWGIQVKVGNERCRHKLGNYPELGLSVAREKAEWYKSQARQGVTPGQADSLEAGSGKTAVSVYEEYIAAGKAGGMRSAPQGWRPNTITNKETILKKYIRPGFGDLTLEELDAANLRLIVEGVRSEDHLTQANRVIADLTHFLAWAAEDVEYISAVPKLPKKTAEVPRDRHLSMTEVAEVYRFANTMSERARDFLHLVLLLGQRRVEIQGMRWSEIDWEQDLWEIPAQRYKTRVAHAVPLPPTVVEILKRRRASVTGAFVFPGDQPGTVYQGVTRLLRTIQDKCAVEAAFTLHDMRRTVRTNLPRLGVEAEIARRVVGHLSKGVDRVYDRYNYLGERRQALEAWATEVLRVAGPQQQADLS